MGDADKTLRRERIIRQNMKWEKTLILKKRHRQEEMVLYLHMYVCISAHTQTVYK